MKFIVLIGRILFSLIFIVSGFNHFGGQMAGYAESKGVPMASMLVPLSGIIAIAGGISILIGFKARAGAWLIIIFLIPVTFAMHDFWNSTDAKEHQMQMVMFMKNISMMGGAFIISYFGSGPLSVDARKKNAVVI